jgi:hypothetical protein
LIVEELPSFDEEGRMLLQPAIGLEYKMVPRGRFRRKIWRVLVQWSGRPREEATWEDYDEIASRFPQFTLEDKGTLNGRGNERVPREDLGLNGCEEEDSTRDAAPMTPMGAFDTPTARAAGAHDTPTARAAEAPQTSHGISMRAREQGTPAPLTSHGSPAMPTPSKQVSQPQTCHGKLMATTWPCHDLAPQQGPDPQPSQAAAEGQEWLTTAATAGGGAPPPLAVTGREVMSMTLGVGGASPPKEEHGGGATV